MDQKDLRELENRCIQEEPPWCSAACPLHVDVRGFVGHVSRGNWPESWKILRKYMPLPGILGRICDAPCRLACKRQEAGGAIRIGELERACVQTAEPPQRIVPLPARGKHVAVAGSGLSSLTAAWDLARKGYAVTIYEAESRLAPSLRNFDPQRLPAESIDAQIAFLLKLPNIQVELGAPLTTPEFAQHGQTAFDAVYLGLDALDLNGPAGVHWALDCHADGRIRVTPRTFATSRKGIFAAGRTENSAASPVWQAAEGRFAAASIDRFLQNVSMTAGREKEGAHATRLFTSLAGVAHRPPVPMADVAVGYAQRKAVEEAGRCLQCACLECVKACDYLEQFGGYPKKYAREIYNNEAIVMGEHKANKLVNSCSLCGLCEAVCPQDFAMQDLCLAARQSMVARGKMPPSAHEFALQDMAFSQSERFSMAQHQPGCTTSQQAFFPGCQLCASAPDQVAAVYAYLRCELAGGVGLILGCCAAPAHWAGRQEQFAQELECIKSQWAALGRPRLIVACSTCYRIFKDHLPRIPIISLWQVLQERPQLPPQHLPANAGPLAIHDPCTTREEPGLQRFVRQLLQRLAVQAEELQLGRELTECCGFGGLMQNANPALARDVARGRADRSPADYVTYCAMCRDNLAAAGKRSLHLLDLLFGSPGTPDPAARKRPGWSQRQENRARLKAQLLKDLWNQAPAANPEYQGIGVHMAPETAELLERRRILLEDVQQVILHAETSGEKFFHPPSGRFKAACKLYKTTFWVEYEPAPDGFTVYNAYAHRMEVRVP
jgi:glutamate synthase (NADPH/NADH) small chain